MKYIVGNFYLQLIYCILISKEIVFTQLSLPVIYSIGGVTAVKSYEVIIVGTN